MSVAAAGLATGRGMIQCDLVVRMKHTLGVSSTSQSRYRVFACNVYAVEFIDSAVEGAPVPLTLGH